MLILSLVASIALAGSPNAGKKTVLVLDVQPETAVIYVDGKKKGTAKKQITLAVTPGNHRVKVVNGGDEHEEVIAVKKGETKTWQWAFEDDRMDKRREKESAESEGDAAP